LLQIYQGEIFGILGDNGAGKSTLVRQMANLLRSYFGSITFFQKNITEARDLVQMNVGYMPYYHFYRKRKGLRPLCIHVASVSVGV
jgi:ABC-type multidrug transport system ATPase subunit